MSIPELEPCPFCGGPGRFSWSRDHEFVNVRCVSWGKECLGAGANCYTEEEAAKKWNRRARPADEMPPAAWRIPLAGMYEYFESKESAIKARREYDESDAILFEAEALYTRPPAAEDAKAIAWESTTPYLIRFITDDVYRQIRPAFRRFYKPYRCSQCAAREKA